MLGKNKSIVYFGWVWFIIINLLNDIVLKRKKKKWYGKASFHSNIKERQCQRMFILPHNCTRLTH